VAYRSATRPHCMQCGKAIAKFTDTVWVRSYPEARAPGLSRHILGPVYSKAECQARVNEEVVSVSYWVHAEGEERRHITHFSIWDGESWKDPFFCNGTCCQQYAYRMARIVKSKS
jgi:hypothetical protein